ncbi:Uncharacterised protein [Mycobacteroides abscessus subsp. abscessus]|nr:Uncharacterised protein [Mycobacteroides abscessus subsp. abscessus]
MPCWAKRRAYSAAAGGTDTSSKEMLSASRSMMAERFPPVLATISLRTSSSWRNSGIISTNMPVISSSSRG